MGLLSYQASDLARRFQGITTGLTSGVLPDRDAVRQLAQEMDQVYSCPSFYHVRKLHNNAAPYAHG